MPHNNNDFEFYQQVVSHISGSLDLSKSMVRVFDFLKDHFPIDGVSLHQYSRRLRAIKLLFLVTKDKFQYVETILPLSKKNAEFIIEHETAEDPLIFSEQVTDSIAENHRKAISHLLPYRPSSYMVGIMRTEEKVIGHLCFIGAGKFTYSEEQIRRMRLLLEPFKLAMSNMLQFKRVMGFQKKLYTEKSGLEKALEQLRDSSIIGERGGLHNTMETVRQLEGKETPVLIMGETGTGKELIADEIQKISSRAGKPFIKVNCGAIPDTLIDSELFGYEKGAFTGASQGRPGRFELADGGTLFLDEVGELPLKAQVRLLRVLQNNVVERIGGKASIPVDVRIIAATNRHLSSMLQDGSFREDLYYRLYVFPIQMPPLRERTEDIPALIHHFVKQACTRMKIEHPPQLHPDSMDQVKQHTWPGNVRELENLVERAIILSQDDFLKLEHFIPKDSKAPLKKESSLDVLIDKKVQAALDRIFGNLTNGSKRDRLEDSFKDRFKSNTNSSDLPTTYPNPQNTVHPLDDIIRHGIVAALAQTKGRVHGAGGAAELLKVNPSTLRNKMRKLNIDAGSWR